jgi:hypothetical protein
MSLTRDAFRLCLVRTLRGRTWAGDFVRDSQQVTIEDAEPDKPAPYIVVYTDDSRSTESIHHRTTSIGQQSALIDIAVTAKMQMVQATDPQTGLPAFDADGAPVLAPMWVDTPTDAQMELALGAIERQVRVAIMHPTCPWADLMRSFGQVQQIVSQRGPSHREGIRFVGRQIQLTVEMSHDPSPGTDPEEHADWRRFLAALRASGEPNAEKTAQHFEQLIRCDAIAWDQITRHRAAAGLTLAQATALLQSEPA